MKVLAIGAHADDVELGCGGTLLKWARAGHELVVHVVSDSGYASPQGVVIRAVADANREAEAAAAFLGARLVVGGLPCLQLGFQAQLNDHMVALMEAEKPDLVLTHWDGDTHADHRAVALATLHACRKVPSVLTYASNWYKGAQAFDPKMFVDITETLDDKLALMALHQSEMSRTGPAWSRWVRAQAENLGFVAGCAAAEGFGVIKHRLALV